MRIHLCQQVKVATTILLFLSPSQFIYSFDRLTFITLPLLFYQPAVQIDLGENPALPLHLVLTLRSSECRKDFHCCVKPPPPAVSNNKTGFGSGALVCTERWSLATPGLWITVNLAGGAVSEGSVCAAGSQSDSLDIENMACRGSVARSSS